MVLFKGHGVPSGVIARLRTAAARTALLLQDEQMSPIKKERWTESAVTGLPAGEHDFFDRKSGALVSSGDFRKDLAKALSAFANSGGGHLVLGVADDGTFDGVNPLRGRTPTREWIEQLIPPLLSPPLGDFRVHEVEPATQSAIPSGGVVIVVDTGDSALAPHQSVEHVQYFYRAGGHSIAAPHFYLDALRNRLTSPRLTAKLAAAIFRAACRQPDGSVFVAAQLNFRVTNDGRVAAYKWALDPTTVQGYPADRDGKYTGDERSFPCDRRETYGIKTDTTILPTRSDIQEVDLGVTLRPDPVDFVELVGEVSAMLSGVTLDYRLVSETSVVEGQAELGGAIEANDWARKIGAAIGAPDH